MDEKRTRKRYIKKFKIEAMILVRKCEGIIAEVDYNLGILPVMLHRWIYEYSTNPEYAFPGLGKLKEPDEEVRVPTMNFVFTSRNIK